SQRKTPPFAWPIQKSPSRRVFASSSIRRALSPPLSRSSSEPLSATDRAILEALSICEASMAEAVIVSYVRSPIGKAYRGAFNETHGAALGGAVIREAVQRAGVAMDEIEDVILGCAFPEGATGRN